MSRSLLYRAFGVRGYWYRATKYSAGKVSFCVEAPREKLVCPKCGSGHVHILEHFKRRWRNVPIGGLATWIEMKVPKVECQECFARRRVPVQFAEPHKRHTRAFQRYVEELLRYMTPQDISRHLDISWDLANDIQKRRLQRKFSRPKLKHLKRLAVDEVYVGKRHKYLTLVLDLDSGAVVFVGQGRGAETLRPFFKKLKRSGARVRAVASDTAVRRLKGHKNVIRAVAFTPDGRHVVSGSSDGTIRFWNVQSGKHVDTIQSRRPVMSLAISSDGNFLAGGMTDAVVILWKLKHDPVITHHHERILSRDSRGDVLSIAFSPDDTKVVAGGNDRQHTRMWNLLVPDERCKSSKINGPITSLVWSRSGERVMLCEKDTRTLRWWPKSADGATSPSRDVRSGKLLIRSGDDPFVIVGGDVFDAETYQVVHSFKQRHGIWAVSAQISNRRNILVTGDVIVNRIPELEPDELVSVWSLNTGETLAVLRERFGQVGNIAISPNGEHVAYGKGDRQISYRQTKDTGDYDLRLWNIGTDEQLREPVPSSDSK